MEYRKSSHSFDQECVEVGVSWTFKTTFDLKATRDMTGG